MKCLVKLVVLGLLVVLEGVRKEKQSRMMVLEVGTPVSFTNIFYKCFSKVSLPVKVGEFPRRHHLQRTRRTRHCREQKEQTLATFEYREASVKASYRVVSTRRGKPTPPPRWTVGLLKWKKKKVGRKVEREDVEKEEVERGLVF